MVMNQALLCGAERTEFKKSEKRFTFFDFTLELLFLILPARFLVDISPPAQGVDHRHVQKELGEVIVRLHNPVVLSPTTIQVTWTVSIARV